MMPQKEKQITDLGNLIKKSLGIPEKDFSKLVSQFYALTTSYYHPCGSEIIVSNSENSKIINY